MSSVTSSRRDSRGGKASADRAGSDRERVRGGAVLGLLLVSLAAWAPPARATPAKPSIVFILTDDQDASLADTMPNLKALAAAQGTTFTHAYYNVPLCSPSRATILTGQYDQNTGVTATTTPVLRRRPPAHGRGLAARRRLPHGPDRQVHQRLPDPAPALRPARLGLLGGAPRRAMQVLASARVRLRPGHERHGRAPRQPASDYATDAFARRRTTSSGRRRRTVCRSSSRSRSTRRTCPPCRRRGTRPRSRRSQAPGCRRSTRPTSATSRPSSGPWACSSPANSTRVPAPGPHAAGGRPRGAADRSAERDRAAGEHLHRLRVRQRLERAAPPAGGKGPALRGGDPDAAVRARPRRRGRAVLAPGRQRRPGADLRRVGGRDLRRPTRRAVLRAAARGPSRPRPAWRQAYPINHSARTGTRAGGGCGPDSTPTSSTPPASGSSTTTSPTPTSCRISPPPPTHAAGAARPAHGRPRGLLGRRLPGAGGRTAVACVEAAAPVAVLGQGRRTGDPPFPTPRPVRCAAELSKIVLWQDGLGGDARTGRMLPCFGAGYSLTSSKTDRRGLRPRGPRPHAPPRHRREGKGTRMADVRDLGRAPLVAAALLLAAAPAQAGGTERVSVGPHGRPPNGSSLGAAVSADGRFVAFSSSATNLLPGEPALGGLFVHDRKTGENRRLVGGILTTDLAVSSDGRFVAFTVAGNFLPGDTNGKARRLCPRPAGGHDRAGERRPDGRQGDRDSGAGFGGVAISADGRFVAFQSDATNLVPGHTGGHQQRLRPRPSGGHDRAGQRRAARPAGHRRRQPQPVRSRRAAASSPSFRTPRSWSRATPTARTTCSSATAGGHDRARERRPERRAARP